MSNQIIKSTTRSGAEFKPELISSEIMTTPPGSAGESQLQNVVTALLEDRRDQLEYTALVGFRFLGV